MQNLSKHELITVTILTGNAGTKFPIPDLPNLRNVKLMGISLYPDEIITNNLSTGNTVMPIANLQLAFLTLVDYGGFEFGNEIPVITLNHATTNVTTSIPYSREETTFEGQNVNWPKSYIEFAVAPAPGADTDIIFSVYYYNQTEADLLQFGNRK